MIAEAPRGRRLEPLRRIAGRMHRTHEAELARISPGSKELEDPLKAAEQVLLTVVWTHESSFKKVPEHIRGYTMQDMQQATRLVVEALQAKYGKTPYNNGFQTYPGSHDLSLNVTNQDMVTLYLQNSSQGRLNNWMALHDLNFADEGYLRMLSGFTDERIVSPRKLTTLYHLDKNLTVDRFRYVFRGIRWMDANFLARLHNPHAAVILPEDLDGFRYRAPRIIQPLFSRKSKTIISQRAITS